MKSNLTKAKDISEATKKAVLERQGYRSISGVSLIGKVIEFHHFIYRSSQGIGYEWNIVAITSEEHRALHDKQDIKVGGLARYSWLEFETLIRNHLLINYDGWSIDKCKYKKGYSKEDYEVRKRENKLNSKR